MTKTSAISSKYGVDIKHHFGSKEVIKETCIPVGVFLEQHEHTYDHLSVLVMGMAEVEVDGEKKVYRGYNIINIPAGKKHKVLALTPVIWLCTHGVAVQDRDNPDPETLNG